MDLKKSEDSGGEDIGGGDIGGGDSESPAKGNHVQSSDSEEEFCDTSMDLGVNAHQLSVIVYYKLYTMYYYNCKVSSLNKCLV